MINIFIHVIGTLEVQITIKMLRAHRVEYTLINEKNEYTICLLH